MTEQTTRLQGAVFGLSGAAGSGKDTVAAMIGARQLAFADVLYREVAEAFGVTVDDLKCRSTKEADQLAYSLERCRHRGFVTFVARDAWPFGFESRPRSPRWVLQRWGDYRRAQDQNYFVDAVRRNILMVGAVNPQPVVISDCRFANEVAMLRELGGKLIQVVRPGVVAGGTGHKSDTDGSEFAPDYVLHNSGTLQDLQAAVHNMLQALAAQAAA